MLTTSHFFRVHSQVRKMTTTVFGKTNTMSMQNMKNWRLIAKFSWHCLHVSTIHINYNQEQYEFFFYLNRDKNWIHRVSHYSVEPSTRTWYQLKQYSEQNQRNVWRGCWLYPSMAQSDTDSNGKLTWYHDMIHKPCTDQIRFVIKLLNKTVTLKQ